MCVQAFPKYDSGSYRATESECNRDECDGQLWYDDNVLLCRKCSTVTNLDQQRREQVLDDPWEQFWDNRDRYHEGGPVRLVGGYLRAYEWVSDEDTSLDAVEPRDFYR